MIKLNFKLEIYNKKFKIKEETITNLKIDMNK